MSDYVLDASALLAALLGEAGEERVQHAIHQGAAISTVNLAEAVSRLASDNVPEEEIRARIARLGVESGPFDEELAYQTGLLRPLTRHLGLSLGDRACLALARRLGLPALTADRTWAALQLDMTVEVIR